MLILDEADRMLDMGFRKEMLRICDEAKTVVSAFYSQLLLKVTA